MTEPERTPKLVLFNQLKERGVLLSRRQVDRLELENRFPKRVPLSDWRVGWVTAEIDAWIEQKITARSTEIGTLGAGDKRTVRRDPGQS